MVIHKNKSLMELSFFLLFLCAALSADNAFAAAMDFVSVVSRKKNFRPNAAICWIQYFKQHNVYMADLIFELSELTSTLVVALIPDFGI